MFRKYSLLSLILIVCCVCLMGAESACDNPPTSDDIQRQQQETLLSEGTSQVGMPAIKNFRERKLLKDILEMRDQSGLVTYTYLENLQPVPVPGKTALGGKLTYLGETIGYGLPYATQFSNPEKYSRQTRGAGGGWDYVVLPQADPNGLFSPSSADATWVLMNDPRGGGLKPLYIEPKIVVSQFKFPPD